MIKNLISEILKQSYKNDYSVGPVKHFPIFIKYKILLLYWQLLNVKQCDFQAETLSNLTALYETKKFIYSVNIFLNQFSLPHRNSTQGYIRNVIYMSF